MLSCRGWVERVGPHGPSQSWGLKGGRPKILCLFFSSHAPIFAHFVSLVVREDARILPIPLEFGQLAEIQLAKVEIGRNRNWPKSNRWKLFCFFFFFFFFCSFCFSLSLFFSFSSSSGSSYFVFVCPQKLEP